MWQGAAVRRDWELEDLIDCWTVTEDEQALVANKYGDTRLGFCLLLKYFALEGRFPAKVADVPDAAVDYMARQVGVAASGFTAGYLSGRSASDHRAQIREYFGFRVCSRADEDKLIDWLAARVCPSELNEERQREALLAKCREDGLEPPGRISRILGAAGRIADERFCAATLARLPAEAAHGLWALIAVDQEAFADESGGSRASSPS